MVLFLVWLLLLLIYAHHPDKSPFILRLLHYWMKPIFALKYNKPIIRLSCVYCTVAWFFFFCRMWHQRDRLEAGAIQAKNEVIKYPDFQLLQSATHFDVVDFSEVLHKLSFELTARPKPFGMLSIMLTIIEQSV